MSVTAAGDHAAGIAAVFQWELSMLGLPPRLELVDQLGGDNHAVSIVIQWTRRGWGGLSGARRLWSPASRPGGRPKFT
jgi:hypothetical protein